MFQGHQHLGQFCVLLRLNNTAIVVYVVGANTIYTYGQLHTGKRRSPLYATVTTGHSRNVLSRSPSTTVSAVNMLL
jgi:hypothetical protein